MTDGSTVTVDEEDFWRFWKVRVFPSNGYACFRDENDRIRRLHREILEVRDKRVVLFLDGNVKNCTRANLFIQERSMLARDRPAKGTCKFKGVSPYRGKWQATIRLDGKLHWLGSFETAEEAALTYDNAVIKHRGRSGVLNFPTRTRRRSRNAQSEQMAGREG